VELAGNRSRTVLGACYQQVPLRILPPFHFGDDQPALLYLLNPTAGLMDGDAQLVDVTARSGTRAVVVGQSATRIHPCLRGFSTQQWRIRVESGAVLVVLPGPAIPFQGSRYYQRVDIDLAAGAGLAWGDIWLPGRYARGGLSEQFQFAMLLQELTVRRAGRLIFRDRFCWRGPWDPATARWHWGSHAACGSLFVAGCPHALAQAGSGPAIEFATAAGDRCIRCQGPAECVTAAVVRTALTAAALCTDQPGDRAWLSEAHALAPNHWFTSDLSDPAC